MWIRASVRSTFLWQITSPPHLLPPVEVARYNSLAPYSNRKGCINVDQLGKQRRPCVSQSVNAGRRWRGKYCFASRGEQIIGGYQKQLHILISPEVSLVAKCNARFNKKKISQLKSDIQSCRCKSFSLKQTSGLMGEGRGRGGDRTSPGSATVVGKRFIGFGGGKAFY